MVEASRWRSWAGLILTTLVLWVSLWLGTGEPVLAGLATVVGLLIWFAGALAQGFAPARRAGLPPVTRPAAAAMAPAAGGRFYSSGALRRRRDSTAGVTSVAAAAPAQDAGQRRERRIRLLAAKYLLPYPDVDDPAVDLGAIAGELVAAPPSWGPGGEADGAQ